MESTQSVSFREWAISFGIDPDFGFMYPPHYLPTFFNKKPLQNAL